MTPAKYALAFLVLIGIGLGLTWALSGDFLERESKVVVGDKKLESPPPSPEIRLAFVGDIMTDRAVENAIIRSGDWKYPFLRIGDYLREFDITFGNLETTISDRGKNIGTSNSFHSDPRVIEGLTYAGFDVVSVANNHIWDWAEDAFLDTMKHLETAGIAHAGGGVDYEDAHTPRILEREGTKFAFLAYTNMLGTWFTRPTAAPASAEYSNWEQVQQDIAKARSEADIVVVSYHWGDEYIPTHTSEQEKVAKATIDAGADLVIGHHPHVAQEVEQYQGGWIVYSLGNFVFDMWERESTMRGLIFDVTVQDKKIKSATTTPIWIGREMQPRLGTSTSV